MDTGNLAVVRGSVVEVTLFLETSSRLRSASASVGGFLLASRQVRRRGHRAACRDGRKAQRDRAPRRGRARASLLNGRTGVVFAKCPLLPQAWLTHSPLAVEASHVGILVIEFLSQTLR